MGYTSHKHTVFQGRCFSHCSRQSLKTDPQSIFKGVTLIKYVGGTGGERVCSNAQLVSVRDQRFAVHGAKALSSGVIPQGFLFVYGTHPLSLDSRYEHVGLIPEDWCVGVAVRLW